MKIYKRELEGRHAHLFCGHWNGSPIEIGMQNQILHKIPEGEVNHYHTYHEYYLVLEGEGELTVEGSTIKLEAGTLVMVEPGECHEVTWINPDTGCRWVIIKEKSEANSKYVVAES